METLSGREIVGVYLFLKAREEELDEILTNLMMRVEKNLYSRLSIDEFERLSDLYRDNVDVFGEKG